MAKLFAIIGDPDQTPHSESALFANDPLGISRLQWVKGEDGVLLTSVI